MDIAGDGTATKTEFRRSIIVMNTAFTRFRGPVSSSPQRARNHFCHVCPSTPYLADRSSY